MCGQAGFSETKKCSVEEVGFQRPGWTWKEEDVIRSESEAVGQESEPAEEKIRSVGHQ